MWSMAGIMVVKLGVEHKKNNVASFKICRKISVNIHKRRGELKGVAGKQLVRYASIHLGWQHWWSRAKGRCLQIFGIPWEHPSIAVSCHSFASSSYLHRPRSHLWVMDSTAAQYFRTKDNISYVEFHCIWMLCGIFHCGNFKSVKITHHAGSKIVVEWMVLYANLQI